MSDVVERREPDTEGTGVLTVSGMSCTANGRVDGFQNQESVLEEDRA